MLLAPRGHGFQSKTKLVAQTIQIRHGSSFRFGKEIRTVAFAVVLRRNAKNVRERFHAGKDPDAFARARLERHRHGSRARPQTNCLVALHSIGKSQSRGAGRMSFLNRC